MAPMAGPSPSTSRRGPVVRCAGLVLVAVLGLTGGSCDNDDPEPPPPTPTDAVPLELDMGEVVTSLDAEASDELQTEVAEALTGYVTSGFLGDYPREDFVDVLEWFTTGGAGLAADDLDQLTASGFEGAQSVVATQLHARLATFAPGGEAAGVSAGIDFAFDVEAGDGSTSDLHLTGRLLLTPQDDGWRIFGYNVHREVLPGGDSS